MDYLSDYLAQAQRWHDTDHGTARGKPIVESVFKVPRVDDVPEGVPADFQDCWLCSPDTSGSQAPHCNPYWYRVTAWKSA